MERVGGFGGKAGNCVQSCTKHADCAAFFLNWVATNKQARQIDVEVGKVDQGAAHRDVGKGEAVYLTAVAEELARYPRLPAGKYRFRVSAANADGVWNETGAARSFYLAPHFTQTYTFYGLCAAAAVVAPAEPSATTCALWSAASSGSIRHTSSPVRRSVPSSASSICTG